MKALICITSEVIWDLRRVERKSERKTFKKFKFLDVFSCTVHIFLLSVHISKPHLESNNK
jgi:hypothetical protein